MALRDHTGTRGAATHTGTLQLGVVLKHQHHQLLPFLGRSIAIIKIVIFLLVEIALMVPQHSRCQRLLLPPTTHSKSKTWREMGRGVAQVLVSLQMVPVPL